MPQEPMLPEDGPTVSSPNSVYILPPRKNRGMPSKKYVPEDGTYK
jgi:hypothetical protein